MLKLVFLICKLVIELLAALLDLLFIDIKSQQVNFDGGRHCLANDVSGFDLTHPGVPQYLLDSAQRSQPTPWILDEQALEEHFDLRGEL